MKTSLFDFTTTEDFCQVEKLSAKRKAQERLFNISNPIFDGEKAARIEQCGTLIGINPTDGRIAAANFCKWRLCPICAWRKSLKKFGENMRIAEHLLEKGYYFVFVTLTVKNCNFEFLSNEIDKLNFSWKRISNRKRFKEAFKGYFKTLEITYNEDKNTWHPHLHILCAVNKSYFKSKYYISAAELRCMWEHCTRADYNMQIDIKRVSIGDTAAAVAEISKYAVKVLNVFNVSEERQFDVVQQLNKDTSSRRLMTCGGVFKTAAADLKIDVESDEIVEDIKEQELVSFRWDGSKYTPYKAMKGGVHFEF